MKGERAGIVVSVFAFLAYCTVVVWGAVVHEPYWDETQAWLIARDASFADLCTHVLRYEGHPPLWYLILAVPAKLGCPYAVAKGIAIVFGATTAFYLLFVLRWIPLLLRVVLPFSYFFAYYWTVVARSYVLLPAILFAIAHVWHRREAHPWRFLLLLIALSQVSVHGFAIAIGLYAVSIFEDRPRRPAIARLVLFGLNAVFLIAVLWPPRDATSAILLQSPLSLDRHAKVVSEIVPSLIQESSDDANAIRAVSLVLAALAAWTLLTVWIVRSGAGLPFLVATLAAYAVALRHFSMWHEGIFYLLLLFGATLAFRVQPRSRLGVIASIVLLLLGLRHAYWTFASLSYDVKHEFSGSAAAAQFLRSRALDRKVVYGAGQAALEHEVYFRSPLFANYRRQRYWEWAPDNPWPDPRFTEASRQQMRAWMARQLRDEPDVFVCASGKLQDEYFLAPLRADPSYRETATFAGSTFWKASPKWPTVFHVFERMRTNDED